VQDGENDTSLPAVLAEICNNLWLLPKVCQGFVYDEFTGIASFLGQDKDQLIELSKQPQTCNRPGSSLWLLNAGMTHRTLALFVVTLQSFEWHIQAGPRRDQDSACLSWPTCHKQHYCRITCPQCSVELCKRCFTCNVLCSYSSGWSPAGRPQAAAHPCKL